MTDTLTSPDQAPGTIAPPDRPAETPPPAPPKPPAADAAPKRPTTRAGRRAATAARAAQPKAPKAPSAAKPTPRRAPLEQRLAQNLAGLGTIVAATGSAVSPAVTADGLLIVEHSANVAAALDRIAKDNPAVAAALERMLTAGVWSGLITALLPIVIGVAGNHGLLPDNLVAMLAAPDPAAAAPPGAPPGA